MTSAPLSTWVTSDPLSRWMTSAALMTSAYLNPWIMTTQMTLVLQQMIQVNDKLNKKPRHEKTNNVISDQVHKTACTVTEDG